MNRIAIALVLALVLTPALAQQSPEERLISGYGQQLALQDLAVARLQALVQSLQAQVAAVTKERDALKSQLADQPPGPDTQK
jgi:uncharacterized protein YggE